MKSIDEIIKIFQNHKLNQGRLISWSKSLYREKHPNNIVCFNANVVSLNHGKIWYGDIDLTLEREILKQIANEIGEDLYVLREMDARFENENLPPKELIKKAIWSTKE
jgi:hypothetical protein